MINKLTLHARKSISHAEKIANARNATAVQPEHLLYGVFLERGSVGATILTNIGLTKEIFEKHFFAAQATGSQQTNGLESSAELKKIITDAHALAAEFGYTYVGTEHIVYALLNTKNAEVRSIINQAKPPKTRAKGQNVIPQNQGLFGIENLSALMGGERDVQSDSALRQFCTFISEQKKEPFIGRNSDIDRITTILGRRTKNNPLIIGEPGIGKTAVVEHIAHLAKSPEAPHYLYGKEIVTLDLTLLVAGTSFRGEFEQRLKNIINEVQENPHIILFIDEIHTIIGTGNTGGSLDAANILKPALARGNVRIIGATTLGEYKKHIEKDAALERRFQKVILAEPSLSDTRKIINGVKKTYENHHHIEITPEAIDAMIRFSDRYISEQFFPDKALDVLDETAARLSNAHHNDELQKQIISLESDLKEMALRKTDCVHNEQYDEATEIRNAEEAITSEIADLREKLKKSIADNKPIMTVEDVARTIATNTGIPYTQILHTADMQIINAKKILAKKIVGQKEVITKIADTLIRSASGLSNINRPRGSFLFLGTTGTGKTFTAKTLAQELFGSPKALIRIDMSELMERHHTSKLLGAPAGYVGYGEGGTLTEKVRRHPHSVVLFDEVEKAHPDVFNILLQILEDGSLTDASGRMINFKNTIIILTSNVGSSELSSDKTLGFTKNVATVQTKTSQKKILAKAREIFAPELLSRLDHIIVFDQLSEKDLITIAQNDLAAIKERLKDRSISLKYSKRIAQKVAEYAMKKNDGARGIRQYLQNTVEGILALHVIKNPHITEMKIDVKNDEIVIL